ncbi:MAG: hypothetical protein JW904_00610 [Spirochaetales bacterium]|nr:hypothetical protein [Spirochaetales bacterium]
MLHSRFILFSALFCISIVVLTAQAAAPIKLSPNEKLFMLSTDKNLFKAADNRMHPRLL